MNSCSSVGLEENVKLLIDKDTLVSVDGERRIIKGGAIAIEGYRIIG